jgi:hypothetical protein
VLGNRAFTRLVRSLAREPAAPAEAPAIDATALALELMTTGTEKLRVRDQDTLASWWPQIMEGLEKPDT